MREALEIEQIYLWGRGIGSMIRDGESILFELLKLESTYFTVPLTPQSQEGTILYALLNFSCLSLSA